MSTLSPPLSRRKARRCKPKRLVRTQRLMDIFNPKEEPVGKPFTEGLATRALGGDDPRTQELVVGWSQSEELQKLGQALAGGIGKRVSGAPLLLPSCLLPPL